MRQCLPQSKLSAALFSKSGLQIRQGRSGVEGRASQKPRNMAMLPLIYCCGVTTYSSHARNMVSKACPPCSNIILSLHRQHLSCFCPSNQTCGAANTADSGPCHNGLYLNLPKSNQPSKLCVHLHNMQEQAVTTLLQYLGSSVMQNWASPKALAIFRKVSLVRRRGDT